MRIVPIGMCQVPTIDSLNTPGSSRDRNTSIGARALLRPQPAVHDIIREKKLKIRIVLTRNRHVPSATDRLLNRHSHIPDVDAHLLLSLPITIGPAVQTVFAKGLNHRITLN